LDDKTLIIIYSVCRKWFSPHTSSAPQPAG